MMASGATSSGSVEVDVVDEEVVDVTDGHDEDCDKEAET